jgi:hypothetical protein
MRPKLPPTRLRGRPAGERDFDIWKSGGVAVNLTVWE